MLNQLINPNIRDISQPELRRSGNGKAIMQFPSYIRQKKFIKSGAGNYFENPLENKISQRENFIFAKSLW
jgi:hypothetical protein